MATGDETRVGSRRELAAVVALAVTGVALRLSQVGLYSAYWPDETHQYLEQAFRLLTGHGLVPWEYVEGMRSRLFPLILAGPMAIGRALDGAEGGLIGARGLVFLFALAMLPAAWMIGRVTSRAHGFAALGAVALWFEVITWSAHVLSETVSITCFLVAAALLMTRTARGPTLAAGALLALGAIMRVQYAPAFGVFAVLVLRTDWRRWGALMVGAVPVLAASAAVDLAFGQWPFEWIYQNYAQTIAGGRGALFGEQPVLWYFGEIWSHWLWAAAFVLIGVARAPAADRPLIATAAANIAVHMTIGHKEYRYIALSLTLFAMVGAIGWVTLLEQARSEAVRRSAAAIVVAATALLSLSLALRGPEDLAMVRRSTMGKLQNVAGRDPALCGMAAAGRDIGQITHHPMDRQVTLYLFARDEMGAVNGPGRRAYNMVIAPPGLALPGYRRGLCNGRSEHEYCLFERPGQCAPAPEIADREVQKFRRDERL